MIFHSSKCKILPLSSKTCKYRMRIFGLGTTWNQKLRVALVRNFLVATYRNPAGIRQKGKKGIYWLSESKNNQTEGRKGRLVSGLNRTRDTKALGLSPLLVLAGLSLGGTLSQGLFSLTTD